MIILGFTAALILTCSCFLMHFVALRSLAKLVYRNEHRLHRPLLIVLLSLFALHLAEVTIYAFGISLLEAAKVGSLTGQIRGSEASWIVDHFYFSIANYTTLGIGDIEPQGALRIVAGIEALNGLILIAWSASFTYLVMEKLWGKGGPAAQED